VIHLHRSLLNPDDYSDLFKAANKRFDYFMCVAKEAGLILEDENYYRFLPKLCVESDFDSIRLENPIAVYNNEAAPLHTVRDTLIDAIVECAKADKDKLAAWHFEDECRTLAWEKQAYLKPLFNDISPEEVAVADPMPFLIQPEFANGFGVLLVHGLLAGPAELRAYGEYLLKQGYTVLGVRLKGHGTSPYALREQSWEDWYGCVQRGFNILKAHCPRIFVAGFSTGGALALKLAAEQYPEMVGVIAVSVPLKFVNPAFMLVPLLHGTNTLVAWVSAFEGVKPFINSESEHPGINYRNVPVRALYELRLLIAQLEELLPQISLPVLIMYGDEDPIVSPKGAPIIMAKLGSKHKQIHAIKSQRHGILMENIDGAWGVIDDFLNELSAVDNKNVGINVLADSPRRHEEHED